MKKKRVLWIIALLMLAVGMSSCGSDDRIMGTGQTSLEPTDSNTDKWLTQDQAWQIVKEKIRLYLLGVLYRRCSLWELESPLQICLCECREWEI